MTAFDTLITILILVGLFLLIYLKLTKKTFKELVIEIKDIIKTASE